MPINILMPALSPTMEKGNLAKWLKKEGDKVKAGDVIAEIETDKATMEYEAIDDGVLAKIVVPEGTQDVAVNALIAVLAQRGRGPEGRGGGGREGAPARASRLKPSRDQRAPEPPHPQPSPQRARRSSRQVRRNVAPLQPSRSGPQALARQEAGSGGQRSGTRVFASPLARRLAKDGRHRPFPHPGQRAAWTRHRARYRGGEVAAAGSRRRRGSRGSPGARDRAFDVGPANPRALRRRQLRGRSARRHAPHHRAAADRLGADHSAFLPDHRLQHRQARRRARGDQRRRPQGQGRQAGLQALGQRLRHQGAGARPAAGARRQRELDRWRHAQAQAFRHRGRGRDAGRPDHADHPQAPRPSRSRPSPTR